MLQAGTSKGLHERDFAGRSRACCDGAQEALERGGFFRHMLAEESLEPVHRAGVQQSGAGDAGRSEADSRGKRPWASDGQEVMGEKLVVWCRLGRGHV